LEERKVEEEEEEEEEEEVTLTLRYILCCEDERSMELA
jgi:hypothetical protein